MISTIKKWIYEIRNYDSLKFQYDELTRVLSGGEWNEGDNRLEAIEVYQQAKYLKEHGEDFLMIMNGNVPEMAAQELFEYFELEVPDDQETEYKTAKALHRILCNWITDPGKMRENWVLWDDLTEAQKERFKEDARFLWYTGHQK